MATLEVHDAEGRVSRVRITRDNPATFGSDPLCDIVLAGPGVAPFHGRIRWKTRRFKVDASPTVASVEVNGKKLASSSLYQGDEIGVGGCRIFVLSTGDDSGHGDKTVIQPDPTAARRGGPSATRPATTPAPVPFHKMEMAPPSLADESDLVPLDDDPVTPPPRPSTPRLAPTDGAKARKKRRSSWKAGLVGRSFDEVASLLADDAADGPGGGGAAVPPVAKKTPIGRARSWVGRWDRAPGDDRVFSSPMVLALIGTLAALILFSVLLRGLIVRDSARRLFADAVARMDDNDDRGAIRAFDQFLAANPADPRSGKARVLRDLARVRQHTGAAGTSWGNALREARAMVDDVGALPEFRDANMDLAEQLRKIAEGLADRARDLAEPSALADSETAVALHGRLAGQAAAALIGRSRIPSKVAAARAAIERKQARVGALAAMDAAIQAGRPDDAYAARSGLVRRYADMANDRDVLARLARANDLIRRAVSFDPAGRAAAAEARREPLGPPTSVVFRLDPGREPTPKGAVAYAQADGFAFGIDASTGAPLWQVAVGASSPFPPVPVAGDGPSALVFDARSNELVRLDGRTGGLAWRQGLGGPVRDAPLILGNQILQATPDGRLLQIDLASGAMRGTLDLHRPLAASPTADESARHLYLMADEGCLFVLTLDPLACVAVEFVGHEAGSIVCPPALVGRFLVVPVNHALREGSWRVFVLDGAGTKLRFAQQVLVGGWTWATPQVSGPVIWSSSDRGELIAFAIGLDDAKAPFTPIARVAPEAEANGPTFVLPRGEREAWVSSTLSGRYELDPERGRLQAGWTLGEAGPAQAPPRIFDRVAVLTQQDAQAPGASLWGVDAASGAVLWRTIVGASWPFVPTGSPSGDGLATLAVDGRAIALPPDRLRAGGFVEQPLPRPGSFRLPPGASRRLEVAGATVVIPGPSADHILVRGESSEFVRVDLPAPIGAMPLAWGPHLLIPGADGRAYLIDPRTGETAADPYVPPFDRARPIRWLAPQPLDDDAVLLPDADGTLRRLVREPSPRPRLVASAEVRLDRPPVADPTSTGAAVLVATADGAIRSLASRDLGAQGSSPLVAPLAIGPVAVDGLGFVIDAANNVLAFAPDGRKLWSARIEGARVAGPPAIRDGSAWFLGLDGAARSLAIADGSSGSPIPLDVLPTGGLLGPGGDLVVPAGVGTLRALQLPPPGANRP